MIPLRYPKENKLVKELSSVSHLTNRSSLTLKVFIMTHFATRYDRSMFIRKFIEMYFPDLYYYQRHFINQTLGQYPITGGLGRGRRHWGFYFYPLWEGDIYHEKIRSVSN